MATASGNVMEKQDIFFYSAGHRLKGYWYPPHGATGPVPGIVCCHGFSAISMCRWSAFRRVLSEAGYDDLTSIAVASAKAKGRADG